MSLRKETDQRGHIQTNSWASFSFFFSFPSLFVPSLRFLPQTSNCIMTRFRSSYLLCLSHILSALCVQTHTHTHVHIFKCCLAFDYQMEGGEYSRTVLIMLHRNDSQTLSKLIAIWSSRINQCAVLEHVRKTSIIWLQAEWNKNTVFVYKVILGRLPLLTDLTVVTVWDCKVWFYCLFQEHGAIWNSSLETEGLGLSAWFYSSYKWWMNQSVLVYVRGILSRTKF